MRMIIILICIVKSLCLMPDLTGMSLALENRDHAYQFTLDEQEITAQTEPERLTVAGRKGVFRGF